MTQWLVNDRLPAWCFFRHYPLPPSRCPPRREAYDVFLPTEVCPGRKHAYRGPGPRGLWCVLQCPAHAQQPAPPVASAPAATETDANDPLEKTNRAVFDFNNQVDKIVLVPVSNAYRAALPEPVRDSIHSVLQNLNEPIIFANDVLQARPDLASTTLARFVVNSTVGIGGIFDVASKANLPFHSNDLGVTFAVWGFGEGPYLMLPILGPSNVRDAIGEGGDAYGDPGNIIASDYHYVLGKLRARRNARGRRAVAQHRDARRYRAHLARLLRDDPVAVPPAPRRRDPARAEQRAERQPGSGRFRAGHRADFVSGRPAVSSVRGPAKMTRRFSAVGAFVVAIALCAGVPRAGAAADATAFVSQLGNQAIQVLGPNVSPSERLARFRELFRNDFDVPGIGQFVLGRYWRVATPAEQQEFLGLFQEYIVEAYSARLGQYGGEPFRVTGSHGGGGEIVVTSQIIQKSGAPIEVDWYLADQGGAFKITDVYVGGVSMKVTERDEFGAVIQRNGGQVAPLLGQLRQKIQR